MDRTGNPLTPVHTHSDGHRRPLRALGAAAAVTAAVAVAELFGGYYSGSLALLADAGHMVTDFTGLLLTFLALHLSRRPPSPRRTFGLHRLEVLAGAGNGLLVAFMAGGLMWASLHRFASPALPRLPSMMGVATLGLLANGLIAWRLKPFASTDLNLRGAFLHVASDALASVGVVAGAGVMALTGWAWVDPALGLAIAGVILWSAFRLLRESGNLLLEGVPGRLSMEEVLAVLRTVPGVTAVRDAHLWGLCSHVVSLSAHLVLAPDRMADQRTALREITDLLRRRFSIDHVTLQLESADWPISHGRPDAPCPEIDDPPSRHRS